MGMIHPQLHCSLELLLGEAAGWGGLVGAPAAGAAPPREDQLDIVRPSPAQQQ
jgi:hypothetical protein